MTKEQSVYREDYPLQGSDLDVALRLVLRFTRDERKNYINRLLSAFKNLIDEDEFALKKRTPFRNEMRDLRRLLHLPADSYLFREDGSKRRWVLGKGAPGATHDFWSRTQMWKMVTSQGDLSAEITTGKASLVKRIDDYFNPEIDSKNVLRDPHKSAIHNLLKYLKMDKGVGSAFPPFHARYLCDYFLPKKQSDYLVIDPCAGWGGRLLGTLAVPRNGAVKYVGIDPEQRNSIAYDALVRRINIWLKKEIHGPREAEFFYSPFEDWLFTSGAKKYFGKADLVITSPPYFGAELYNPDNLSQSFNRYPAYEDWVDGFYRPLVDGAYALLKPGGVFVLNIAKIKAKPRMKGGEQLEIDARRLAKEIGFENAGFFKLAMSKTPGTKEAIEQPKKGKSIHVLSVNGITWKYEPVFCFRKPSDATSLPNKAIKRVTHEEGHRSIPKVERLSWDALRTLYKPYDKTCNDSFKRIKQKDKPSIIFLKGKPVAGAVINRRSSAGYECLYKGKKRSVPSIKYEKGDIELSKFSVFDHSPEAKKHIIDHLRGIPRPCIVEVNSACKTEIELLKQSGFSLADASVNSMGDVYHLYIDSKNCDSRKQAIDDAERINVKQFTGIEFSSLAKRIEKKLAEENLIYRNHDSHYNMRDSWGALSLRGYTPDPLDIESLEESAAYQRQINVELREKYHSSQLGLQDTSLMAMFPEVQEILDRIVPNSSKNGNVAFKRVRFMRITPKGGELTRHTDLTDQTLGIENGKTVRLHVPIKTNPKVMVTSWSLMNLPTKKHFAQGELWYLNIRLPHKVINGGDEDRVHLVIDAIADDRIRALIKGVSAPTTKKNATTVKSGKADSDADHYLSLVADWHDPHPAPVIETHEGFLVVRDDLLRHGSKMRFIDYMVRTATEKEFVFGGSNKVGWGAISLAAVCKRYRKKAVFFMAKTSNPTWHQQEVERLGGRIEWVANGMLNVTLARARAYAEADPKKRRLLPIGLEDPTVIGSIIKVAQGLSVSPKEVWAVASSGTLTRGLQLAFPRAKFFAVQTGHTLTEESAGRAEVLVSPYKYDKPVRAEDAPPYPSEPFYDAKLWSFARKHGKKGALIWNVA